MASESDTTLFCVCNLNRTRGPLLPKVQITQCLLLIGINTRSFRKICSDAAMLRFHYVECGSELLCSHAQGGTRNLRISTTRDKDINNLPVLGILVVHLSITQDKIVRNQSAMAIAPNWHDQHDIAQPVNAIILRLSLLWVLTRF